jgi:hypothetical protein
MLRLLPKIISSNPKIPTTMTAETTTIKRTEPKENNKGKDTININNTNNNTKYNKANSNSSEEKMTTEMTIVLSFKIMQLKLLHMVGW